MNNDKTHLPTVGIITLHYVDNHGGVLLAYALQEKIRQLGYEPFLIEYDPTPVPSRVAHFTKTWLRRIRLLPSYLLKIGSFFRRLALAGLAMPARHMHKSSGKRAVAFASFRSRFIRTTSQSWRTEESLVKAPPRFDAYVCGSDQIWNPYMCRPNHSPGFDGAYFLDFAPKEQRVSYAPSVSVPEIPESHKASFSRLASGVRFLSCREEAGAKLIEEAVGRPVKVVVDPALLLTSSDWHLVAKKPAEARYIICYFLGEGRHYREFALSLSRRLGLVLKVISADPADADQLEGEYCQDIGPDEFLGLIESAECVCTDSFHGTLFSIIFERPFFVFERPGSSGSKSMSSRIHSILSRLDLMDRFISEDCTADSVSAKVDFSLARRRLAVLRNDSIVYLRDSLAATQTKP